MIAAPRNHAVLYEDDVIRILAVSVAPRGARIERVGCAVPGDVDDDGVLLLRLGEKSEERVAYALRGCVSIQQQQRVFIGHCSACGRLEKIKHRRGITVGREGRLLLVPIVSDMTYDAIMRAVADLQVTR